uniref:Sperm associated antigen 1 n=1 Tax=Podarcis muralis TaxID=64176 RepID=A0A670K4V8_PODMU
MSADQVSCLLSQGTTKTYQIPIEHLDYKFIETCKDVKHLEKILKILRSGEEGFYPDLVLFCEKRIESLAPNSRALRRDKPAATASDFTTEEWKEIENEMKSWITEMKEDEYKMRYATTEVFKEKVENLPPVRSSDSSLPSRQVGIYVSIQYSISIFFFNVFDVEKECSKIDGYEETKSKPSFKTTNKGLPKSDIDTTGLTTKEKIFIANREKEKGNEAFVTGDYKEAVIYYTRSISAFPTVAAYNNKAQAEIKLQNWHVAHQDCETVLKMDPENIKAFMRRATVYTNLHNFKAAAEDLKKVLQIEPENATAKKNLLDIEKKLKELEPISQTNSKGKKILIQDIEDSDGDEELGGNEAECENGSGDKSNFNLLSVNGRTWRIQSPEDLSILYSNRAACYLKEGNCVDCIQDCNSALELHPYSLKPLLRRAMAYESMERYRQAYVDYKTVLQIDSGIQVANDSVNRITRTLIEEDGPNWREKLSPIPVVPVSAQLHWWDGGSVTAEPKQKKNPGLSSEKQMFKSLKNKGNEFVKKGNYEEALIKYNECIKLNSQEQTIYTNRALCYLKLFQYEEAKKDCDHVLQIDDSNIKALYRRALAHKGLQLQETTQLLKLKNEHTVNGQQKQRKKIEIQEVNEEEEARETCASEKATSNHDSAKGETDAVPMNSSEKLIISKPSNAYEFGQIINVVNANKDIAACAELLTAIEPKDLPALLSNKLEGDIFLLFIQALQSDVFCQDPGLVYQHLVHLSRAERFKMVLTLLSKNEVEQVQQLFDSLSKEENQQFSLDDLKSLKRDFEL